MNIDSQSPSILLQPVFWIISVIGSVILSVIANLVTPRIAKRFEEIGHVKRSVIKLKQARFLSQVIDIESHPERLTQAKLDSIYATILASFSMVVCLVMFSSGMLLDRFTWGISNIIGLIAGTAFAWSSIEIVKVGHKRMLIARSFEKRRKAKDEFAMKHPNATSTMMETFLLEWDKREFGVTVAEIPLILKGTTPAIMQ